MTQFEQGEEAASCQFLSQTRGIKRPRRSDRTYKERIGVRRSTVATMGWSCCVQLLVNTKRKYTCVFLVFVVFE
ncbi:hypothetical protein K445DRAFT_316869 [Daldinia sp. EC12]|nr:hypothetical protein K445DRAFT_316869 [Daldinia sp. EC12]